jgi:hypothetical protein
MYTLIFPSIGFLLGVASTITFPLVLPQVHNNRLVRHSPFLLAVLWCFDTLFPLFIWRCIGVLLSARGVSSHLSVVSAFEYVGFANSEGKYKLDSNIFLVLDVEYALTVYFQACMDRLVCLT